MRLKKLLFATLMYSLTTHGQHQGLHSLQHHIHTILSRFTRPYTVASYLLPIDLVCDYATTSSCATCISFTPHAWAADAVATVQSQALENITIVTKQLSPAEIERFNECEHVDVFILNTAQTDYEYDSPQFIATLLETASIVLFVVAQDGPEKYHIEQALTHLQRTFTTHPPLLPTDEQVLIEAIGTRSTLKRGYWVVDTQYLDRWSIKSNYHEKYLIKTSKQRHKTVSWLPGINLITFKMLNGVYPTNQMIKLFLTTHQELHPDPFMWNIIVHGTSYSFIDYENESPYTFCQHKACTYNLKLLDADIETMTAYIKTKKHIRECKKTRHKILSGYE